MKQITKRQQELKTQIGNLIALKTNEMAGDNDPRYISDLNLSIKHCKEQLKVATFESKHYQMVK